MLTPYFELSQTGDKLLIVIHAPYSNLKDLEIYVSENDFRFYSSPYYLRLHLPGLVKDSDEPTSRYNADNGQFTIELIKCTPGEDFKDLDLIAKFLSPQKQKRIQVKPEIQVLSSSTNDDNDSNSGDDDHDEPYDSSDEWFIEQKEPTSIDHSFDPQRSKYGFANTLSNVFNVIKDEFKEVFDIVNIEETLDDDRNSLREAVELETFSDDHYLFDLMEPSEELMESLQYNAVYSADVTFTTEESEKLKNMGNKKYFLSKEQRQIAYLSLIDILYSYTYDYRTTLGESTVESPWTVNKLSATLCWLQSYRSVNEVVTCSVRRALCYPLFRHWGLSIKVLDDTANVLKSGVRQVIRCLLNIHEMFNNSEPRYILNQLYITDYCIWLQNEHHVDKKLCKLSDIILEVKKDLQKTFFDIDILETAAASTFEDNVTQSLCNLNINRSEKPNASSSESEDSESDSEDTENDSDDESSTDTELDSDDDVPHNNNIKTDLCKQ